MEAFSEDSNSLAIENKLKNDAPTIETALKNFVALLVGKSLTASTLDTEIKFRSTQPLENPSVFFTSKDALSCARLLSKKINAFQLPDVLSWGIQYCPQEDSQTGISRLDQLARYRVLHDLQHLVVQKSQKPTKLFGKLYFIYSGSDITSRKDSPTGFCSVWSAICTEIVTENNRDGIVSQELLVDFLENFGSSLHHSQSKLDSVQHCDADLIWTNDFSESLKRRQIQRKQEIERRALIETVYDDDESKLPSTEDSK
jgi:hypothetical protein